MGMREEIEALLAHVSVGGVDLLPRSDVLRIIDKHAAPVVDMTPGMQPRQPSKDVGELPTWLQHLRRLDYEGVAMGGMAARDRFLYPELADLDNLRRVILSGQGEAVIPMEMQPLLGLSRCNITRLIYFGREPSDTGYVVVPGAPTNKPYGKAILLSALDSYANSLINP